MMIALLLWKCDYDDSTSSYDLILLNTTSFNSPHNSSIQLILGFILICQRINLLLHRSIPDSMKDGGIVWLYQVSIESVVNDEVQ